MKHLNHIIRPLQKFSKGMVALFAVKLIVFACVFTFDSCKKQELSSTYNHEANTKFRAAIEKNKATVGSTLLSNLTGSQLQNYQVMTPALTSGIESSLLSIYVNFPSSVTSQTLTQFGNINSIQSLSDLLQNTNAVVQYEPTSTNSNYSLNVDTNVIIASLNPLVQESKQFLYSKGFTEQEIQQMLVEENAIETDLILLTMVIAENEISYPVARNYSSIFINSAQALTWGEVGHCAAHALGADVLYSLATSGATAWTMGAIKTAFKAVARRMYGCIGVAIAVADFALCLGGVEL